MNILCYVAPATSKPNIQIIFFKTEYEEEINFGSGFNKSGVAKSPPTAYKEGPLPTISDSVFSLIILVTSIFIDFVVTLFRTKYRILDWNSMFSIQTMI